jgi:hypothetical protein
MTAGRKGRSLADIVAGDLDLDAAAPIEAPAPEPAASPPSTVPAVVPVNVLVDPADRRRLRQLSLDTGLSLQRLGHEAWNRLLEARGLPPLRPVAANVPSGRRRKVP